MLNKLKLASSLAIYFYRTLQNRIFIYALAILLLVEGILPSLQLVLLQELINFKMPHATPLLFTLSLYALFLLTEALISSIIPFIKRKLGEEALINHSLQLFDAVDKAPDMTFYENEKYQTELDNLKDLASWLPLQLIEFTHKTIVFSITTMSLFMLLWKLSIVMSIMLIIAPWPYAILRYHFSYLEWEYDIKFAKERRRLTYTRDLFLSTSAIKELKIFDIAYYFKNIYAKIFNQILAWYASSQQSYIKRMILRGSWVSIVAISGLIYLFQKQDLSVGEVALYIGSVLALTNVIQALVNYGAETFDLWQRYNKFYKFIHLYPSVKVVNDQNNIATPLELPELSDLELSDLKLSDITIEFKQVTFSYNQHTDKVLDQVSFTIPANTTVAIVGENGSGKSTIVKLLCGLYKPQSGQILINQQLLTESNASYWRQNLGLVFQKFGKYDLTIAENIAFEKAHTIGLDLQNITKQLELDQVIRQYPQGYETLLGPYWGGKNLSGGEWQKIALARALIRNANLLIFDEPTSALDIETEYQLIQKIKSFKANKTILLISHRFSTVRLADKIIVLDQHRIIETGTHEELMQYQGKYATMFKYQTETN